MDKFLKCDLHMHSSSCYSRKYKQDEFIDYMKNVDLDVFSITDHNVIDVGLYKRLISELPKDKKIIGGVELNISLDNETIEKYSLVVSDNYFNAVLWFSIEDLDVFWEKLVELLIETGINVDKQEIKQISKATEGIDFKLLKIQEKFKNINYFLTFHEGKGARNLSNYLRNTDLSTKKPIISNQKFKHKLFYYNNKLAIEGGRKTQAISNYFEEQLNTLITRFFFSDALTLEEIGKKYTWINFDGKFSSLMLPMSDPETRVFTSDEFPDNPQKNLATFLESIKFYIIDQKTKQESEKIIYFSPSYNGIIGSRGSGKSLLGSILADKNFSKYNKFIDQSKTQYKIFGKEYQYNSPNSKILEQNSLFEIFKSGEIKNIDFIKDFYKTLESTKKTTISEFTKNAKLLLDYEKQLFINLHEEYQSSIKDISFLEASVNEDYMIPMINLKAFQNGDDFITRLQAEFVDFRTNLSQIKNKLQDFKNPSIEYIELEEFNTIISEFKKQTNEQLIKIEDQLNITTTKVNKFDKTYIKIRTKLINEYIKRVINENLNTDKPSQTISTDKELAIQQLKDFTSFRAKSHRIFEFIYVELENVKKETKSDDVPINKVDKLVISSTIEELKEYSAYIADELKNYSKDRHDEVMFDILMQYKDLENLKNLFNGQKYKANSLHSNNEYLDKFYSNMIANIQKFDNFTIKLYFNDKNIEEYSPGKKSEILLDIFLDKSLLSKDYIFIVLDQPEDNLDTKTITKELITKLRELKKEIQIFVISHSASVIINGDAEQVIYACDNDGSINYTQGRIIDDCMKQNVVETLDGGEKNLKMRLNKYDFKLKENYND